MFGKGSAIPTTTILLLLDTVGIFSILLKKLKKYTTNPRYNGLFFLKITENTKLIASILIKHDI